MFKSIMTKLITFYVQVNLLLNIKAYYIYAVHLVLFLC